MEPPHKIFGIIGNIRMQIRRNPCGQEESPAHEFRSLVRICHEQVINEMRHKRVKTEKTSRLSKNRCWAGLRCFFALLWRVACEIDESMLAPRILGEFGDGLADGVARRARPKESTQATRASVLLLVLIRDSQASLRRLSHTLRIGLINERDIPDGLWISESRSREFSRPSLRYILQ